MATKQIPLKWRKYINPILRKLFRLELTAVLDADTREVIGIGVRKYHKALSEEGQRELFESLAQDLMGAMQEVPQMGANCIKMLDGVIDSLEGNHEGAG